MQHEWFRQATDTMALARALLPLPRLDLVRKDMIAHGATATSAALAAAAALSGSASSAGYHGICRHRWQLRWTLPLRGPSDFGSCGSSSSTGFCPAPSAAGGRGSSSRCMCGLGSSSPEHRRSCWHSHRQCGLVLSAARVRVHSHGMWILRPSSSCMTRWQQRQQGHTQCAFSRPAGPALQGYEWALQVEITQTRGATGFDSSKPWALGVFLTCQVAEVPSRRNISHRAGIH